MSKCTPETLFYKDARKDAPFVGVDKNNIHDMFELVEELDSLLKDVAYDLFILYMKKIVMN